jgi:hypothetical protein
MTYNFKEMVLALNIYKAQCHKALTLIAAKLSRYPFDLAGHAA